MPKNRFLSVVILALLWLELRGGQAQGQDCNRNDIEDAIDIAEGRSADCNRNGVPDECDLSPLITLAPAVDLDLAGKPAAVAGGDMDGDGDVDLAVAFPGPSRLASTIALLRNRGDGTFQDAGTIEVGGPDPGALAAANLDGDGDVDLAVGVDSAVIVLPNAGDGSFTTAGRSVPPPRFVRFLEAADLDGDGDLDLAFISHGNARNPRSGAAGVLLNNGQGVFAFMSQFSTGLAFLDLEIADLDGDGDPDIAYRREAASSSS